MLEAAITGSVLVLIILLVRFIAHGKISSRLQYALWGLVLLRLIFPFSLFESSASLMNVVEETRPYANVQMLHGLDQIELSESGAVEGYYKADYMRDFPTKIVGSASPEDFARLTRTLSARDILVPLWRLGSIALGLWFLISNLSFSTKLRKSRRPFGADFRLPVFVSEGISSPCLFGVFSPKIYLTPKAANCENVKHVLLHEYCHFLHGDNFWAVLRCLCLALYWWNPLVWVAAILSKHDGELACDEAVIKRLGEQNRLSYGKTLVDMIALKAHPGNLICTATTMTGGKKSIKARISAIAQRRKNLALAVIFVVLVTAVAVGCTFTGSKEVLKPKVPFPMPEHLITFELSMDGEQVGLYDRNEGNMGAHYQSIFSQYDWQELPSDEVPAQLEETSDYVLSIQYDDDVGRNTDRIFFFSDSDLVCIRENKADTWYKTTYAPSSEEPDEYSEKISLYRTLRLEYDQAELYSTRIRFVSEYEDFSDTANLGVERLCERLGRLSPESAYGGSDFIFDSSDIKITYSSPNEKDYTIQVPIRCKIGNIGTYPNQLNWVTREYVLKLSHGENNWWVLTVEDRSLADEFALAEIESLYKDYGMKLKFGGRNATKMWNLIVDWTENNEPDFVEERVLDVVEDANNYFWFKNTYEIENLLYPAPAPKIGEPAEVFGDEPISLLIRHFGILMDSYTLSYTTELGEDVELYFVDGTLYTMTISQSASDGAPRHTVVFNYIEGVVGVWNASDMYSYPMPESLMLPGVFVPDALKPTIESPLPQN